jgi:hypothetical protein
MQRVVGLMTHYRAGLRTRFNQRQNKVWLETHWRRGATDVHKRPNLYLQDLNISSVYITYYTHKVNLDNNIFMMLLSNFTLAFFMLWPHMQWWRKHEKSNGQIGQLHPEDVVIRDVLQRPKPSFARQYPKPYLFLYATLIYSNTLLVPSHRWHPKRSSPWP